MGICETKLDGSFPEAQFSVKNFKCHRQDRTCHGGGLVMYLKSDIPHRRRHDLENLIWNALPNHGVEILIIEVVMSERDKWIYVLLYKPPRIQTCSEILSMLCEIILKETQNVIILGDLNYDTSDYHNFICVSTKMHAPSVAPTITQYRSYRKFCDKDFLYDLVALDHSMLYAGGSLEDKMHLFHSGLTDIIDRHAPIKRKIVKHSQVPYMNGEWRKVNHLRNFCEKMIALSVTQLQWLMCLIHTL